MASQTEKIVSVVSLVVAILGTIAAWLAIPGLRACKPETPETVTTHSVEPPAPANGTQPPREAESATARSGVQSTLRFDVTKCKYERKWIRCEAEVTNLGDAERSLRLVCDDEQHKATFVDSRGLRYESKMCYIGGDLTNNEIVHVLEPNVRYAIWASFEFGSTRPKGKARLFQFYVREGGDPSSAAVLKPIRFRDVVVQ